MDKILEDIKNMPAPPLMFHFPEELGRPPLKMTYGLEMDIRRLLPDPQTSMQLLLSDPYTQDYVLRRCLTPKKAMLLDPANELIPAEEVDLDSETIDKLLMWAMEHALYFFAKRASSLASLGTQFQHLLPNHPLAQSSNGSTDSPSTPPSAGDSTVSNPT